MSVKYGISWIIVTQTFAWITFFGIYAFLATANLDIPGILKERGYGPDLISLAEKGGLWALTFALNRLIMPVRLGLSVLVMPWLAGPVNALVQPYIDKWNGKEEPKYVPVPIKKEEKKTK